MFGLLQISVFNGFLFRARFFDFLINKNACYFRKFYLIKISSTMVYNGVSDRYTEKRIWLYTYIWLKRFLLFIKEMTSFEFRRYAVPKSSIFKHDKRFYFVGGIIVRWSNGSLVILNKTYEIQLNFLNNSFVCGVTISGLLLK